MKTTGHQIKESIEAWKIKRELAADAFKKALFRFADEEKQSPEEIFANYTRAEDAIIKLQVAQSEYNLKISLTVNGQSYVLAEAVKKIGVLTRAIKNWKDSLKAQAVESSSWDRTNRFVRNKDEQVATKTISDQRCAVLVTKFSQAKNALQGAIAIANATFAEITDLDENLLS